MPVRRDYGRRLGLTASSGVTHRQSVEMHTGLELDVRVQSTGYPPDLHRVIHKLSPDLGRSAHISMPLELWFWGRKTPTCQRRDVTVSCQPCPHQSTGVHRRSPQSVDKRHPRFPQMWTNPGEIDVDRHGGSHLCPQPVDACGLPVEGSGDDEAVASQRFPQDWG